MRVKERRVFTIVDVFTKIGGMLGLVTTVCAFMTKGFQKMIFLSDIMSAFFFEDDINPPINISKLKDNDPVTRIRAVKNIRFSICEQMSMRCRRKANERKLLYQRTI